MPQPKQPKRTANRKSSDNLVLLKLLGRKFQCVKKGFYYILCRAENLSKKKTKRRHENDMKLAGRSHFLVDLSIIESNKIK